LDQRNGTRRDEVKRIQVAAYSGYKANERPLYFVVDDHKRMVKEVLDRWYGLEHDFYKVLADDGRVYLLQWHRSLDVWLLKESFERRGAH
jgi:hypothetical protein